MLFSTTYSRTGSHYLVVGDRHQENCTTSSKRKLYTTSGKINLHFVRVSTLEYGSTPPGGRVKAEREFVCDVSDFDIVYGRAVSLYCCD